MRMWNVDPKLLCQKHLCGEHLETHMFHGTIKKKRSILGFITKGLVEVHNIKKRHDDLVKEMLSRNYNHKTELPEFDSWEAGSVDVEQNVIILKNKCKECKERMEK
jgi:hypothetical protein